MAVRAPRRSKTELIKDEIAKITKKIEAAEQQIISLKEQKALKEEELKEVQNAMDKARKEAEGKAILELLDKNNISLDALKQLIDSKEPEVVAALEEM